MSTTSPVSPDPGSVEVRHDLAHVPLAPPSRTSGILEVFRRRYLLRLMVRREIRARYAGTAFGLAWSYINPFTRFLTFYFVFRIVLGRGKEATTQAAPIPEDPEELTVAAPEITEDPALSDAEARAKAA